MLKKIILSAALLFALAAGTVAVLTVQKQPAAAREPCVVALTCSSVVSLPPVW